MISENTIKTKLLFEYMGVDASKLTDEVLENIEANEHINDYLARILGMERHHGSPFQRKIDKWYNFDRLKLHPDIFQYAIKDFLINELPEALATYVRGQFKGSTEKITAAKIKSTLNNVLQENPNFWYDDDFKEIFLDRFSVDYPLSCDGSKQIIKTVDKTPTAASAKALQAQPSKPSKIKGNGNKKNEKLGVKSLIGLVVIIIFIYWLFF